MNNKPQMAQSYQTVVIGSATPNFLTVAVDELLTYRTPKKIVDYIEAEKLKAIIGNPPYNVNGHYRITVSGLAKLPNTKAKLKYKC